MAIQEAVLAIPERWFADVEGAPLVYERVCSAQVAGRYITKYVLANEGPATLDVAVERIQNLLRNNQALCRTFPLENLRETVQQRHYLTINGDAVCLSKIRYTDKAEYKDRYFSEDLLEHPIRCERGHLLEKQSADFWVTAKGLFCPVLPQHSIGNRQEDEELANDIRAHRLAQQDEGNRFERLRARQENQAREQEIQAALIRMQGQQIAHRGIIGGEIVQFVGDGGKIVLKIGAKKVCSKIVGKEVAKEVAKEVGKEVAKKAATTFTQKVAKGTLKLIPGVSLVVGLALGIYRFTGKEWVRGVGEIASGIAAIVPGYGTAVSVMIDVAIAGGDIYEVFNREDPLDLPQAYALLNIDPTQNRNPTQGEVDAAYREQARQVHPDILGRVNEAARRQGEVITQLLNDARDFIYTKRGWRVAQ